MSAPPPVMATVQVAADPWNAFATFTAMGRWWDPAYSPDPAGWRGVLVEPRVGGSVLFPLATGDVRWGEVTTWEPGHRYAQTFTLGLDQPTTLVVEFSQPDGDDGPTTVVLAHGGWPPGSDQARERYADWSQLLARFARVVDGGEPD